MPRSAASKLTTAPSARNLYQLTPRELIAELVEADMAPGVLETNWPNLMNLAHKDEIELANLLGLAPGPARRLASAIELHHRLGSESRTGTN